MPRPPILSRRMFCSCIGIAYPFATSLRAHSAGDHAMIDLSATSPGSLPAGFVTARTGKGSAEAWRVEEDGSVTGGRVLTQTSTDQTDYRFPLAIYEQGFPSDCKCVFHQKSALRSLRFGRR